MKIYKKLPYFRYNVILVIKGKFESTDLDRPYARIYNVEEILCDPEESCEYAYSKKMNHGLWYDFETQRLYGKISDLSYKEYISIRDKINKHKYKKLCFQLHKNREYENIKRKAERKHAEKMQCRKA